MAVFDSSEADEFLSLLGKNGASRVRAFWPKKRPVPPGTPRAFTGTYSNAKDGKIETWIRRGLGVYVVIGNGGDSDDEITDCPALFVEWDQMPKAEQLGAWKRFDLPEPSFAVDTAGKSIHLYWVLDQPITPERFRELIAKLIAKTGADPTNRNPSRVMRMPGAWHFSWDENDQKLLRNGQSTLIQCSGNRYSPELFDQLLADPEPAQRQIAEVPFAVPADDLPPRPIEHLFDAMQRVPEFEHGQGRYDELLKLAMRLHVEIGRDAALELLRSHSPHVSDIEAYFTKTPDRISPGSIWPFLREQYGIDISRRDLHQVDPTGVSGFVDMGGDGTSASVTNAPGAPAMQMQQKTKRRTLAPDEVKELVPHRLGGIPKLNIRTNSFHAGGSIYTADDLGRIYVHLSSASERWPKETTADVVVELAKERAFDPVEEMLNRIGKTTEPLPEELWSRLDLHLLGINDPVAADFLPQFLLSAVARIFRPGCGVRRSPVLIGPQWRGKTRLGRILFGDDHWVENVSDLGKDDLLRLQAGWGIELSELNGITRRKDQEALKAFLTAADDVYRAPYGKGVARYQRRCVFWGTSNGPPLRDLSGSTRFVCIKLPDSQLPLEWAIKHRDAIWAKAVAIYRQIPAGDEPWDRSTEEQRIAIQERNSNHQEIDPWAEEVESILEGALDHPVSIPYVLDRMEIPKTYRNNAMAARVRQLAESFGWAFERRRPPGLKTKRQGLWPPDRSADQNGGHPGHPVGTPRGAQENASDTRAPDPSGHPGHPISIKVETEEGRGEGPEAQQPRAEGFESFGVPTVSDHSEASPAERSEWAPRGAHRGAHRGAQGQRVHTTAGSGITPGIYKVTHDLGDGRLEIIGPEGAKHQFPVLIKASLVEPVNEDDDF